MFFNIWQSVQVTTQEHPRFKQAGTVQSGKLEDGSFLVKFDADGVTEATPADELRGL